MNTSVELENNLGSGVEWVGRGHADGGMSANGSYDRPSQRHQELRQEGAVGRGEEGST